MFQKCTFLILFVSAFLMGCADLTDGSLDFDPDPQDGSVQLPDPAENLYVVASLSVDGETGKIVGAEALDPEGTFKILVEDAALEEKYAEIRLSPNKLNLLYARKNGDVTDLVLYNILSETTVTILANAKSNESEFIDDDHVLFTDDGVLKVYNIQGASSYLLVDRWYDRCNHWSQISPDFDRIVYKDQDPSKTDEAHHAWSTVSLGQKSTDCNEIFPYDGEDNPVELYDNFYYNWLDNDLVIFKKKPGVTNRIYGIDLGDSYSSISSYLTSDGTEVRFEKLLISPDKETLLIYGNYGVYTFNLVNQELSSDTAVEELYSDEYQLFKTKFAAFGSQSKSLVVGTSNWIGVYNIDSLEKTNASLGYMLNGNAVVYSLHCR